MPKDFVYNSIYKGSLSRGATERMAKERAQIGTENYLKNKFQGKAVKYIEDEIKIALSLSKRDKK